MIPKSKNPTITLSIQVALGRIPLGSFENLGVDVYIGVPAPQNFDVITVGKLLIKEMLYDTAIENGVVKITNISLELYERALKTLQDYFIAQSVEYRLDITGKITQEDWRRLTYYYHGDPQSRRVKYKGDNITPENFAKKLVEISLKYKQKNDHTNI